MYQYLLLRIAPGRTSNSPQSSPWKWPLCKVGL